MHCQPKQPVLYLVKFQDNFKLSLWEIESITHRSNLDIQIIYEDIVIKMGAGCYRNFKAKWEWKTLHETATKTAAADDKS